MPSANAAVTLDAERLLFDKGVTVVADHVASCGGILYGQMTNEGFGAAHFRRMVDGPVALKMRRVFEEAASRSVSPAEVGREHSWSNYRRQCEQLAARPAGGVALRVEQLRRRGIGWLPGKVARDPARGRTTAVRDDGAGVRPLRRDDQRRRHRGIAAGHRHSDEVGIDRESPVRPIEAPVARHGEAAFAVADRRLAGREIGRHARHESMQSQTTEQSDHLSG